MADRIFSDPAVARAVDRLPNFPLGIKPLPSGAAVASKIADGIERRKARVYAPWMVRVTFLLRGVYAHFDGVLGRFVMDIAARIQEFRTMR